METVSCRGETALAWAQLRGHKDIIRLLEDAGDLKACSYKSRN